MSQSNPANLPISNRFTGQIYDDDTGLYYFGARYYDPSIGRFIQPDPVVPAAGADSQELNRYSYVDNNPLKLVDPTGFDDTFSAPDLSLGNFDSSSPAFNFGNFTMGPDTTGFITPDLGLSSGSGSDSSGGGFTLVGSFNPADNSGGWASLGSQPAAPSDVSTLTGPNPYAVAAAQTGWLLSNFLYGAASPFRWIQQNILDPLGLTTDQQMNLMISYPSLASEAGAIWTEVVTYGETVETIEQVTAAAESAGASETSTILQNAAKGQAFEQKGVSYLQTIKCANQ